VGDALRGIGFDASDKERVKLVRPSDIMTTEPVIQDCFNRGLFNWGDNPCLRWAVNNTKRIPRGKKEGTDTGNFYYGKIEAKSRKTDPFMALVASMTVEDVLGTGETAELPPIGAIRL
jgi:phage terminase large subunit-like protein